MKTPEQMAEDILHGVGKVASELWGDDEQAKKFAEAIRGTWLAGYQAAKPQWISVKERLPNIGDPCLVTCHEERYAIAEYDGTKWTTLNSIAYYHPIVTHWHPLPEAPKEEK